MANLQIIISESALTFNPTVEPGVNAPVTTGGYIYWKNNSDKTVTVNCSLVANQSPPASPPANAKDNFPIPKSQTKTIAIIKASVPDISKTPGGNSAPVSEWHLPQGYLVNFKVHWAGAGTNDLEWTIDPIAPVSCTATLKKNADGTYYIDYSGGGTFVNAGGGDTITFATDSSVTDPVGVHFTPFLEHRTGIGTFTLGGGNPSAPLVDRTFVFHFFYEENGTWFDPVGTIIMD